jgi:peptidoglycan hydrolase-like protein with peptidoglycan-binding domain
VRVWQQIVRVTVDGVFGRKTEVATRNFQSAHHLKIDGIVGPKTWQKAQELHAG